MIYSIQPDEEVIADARNSMRKQTKIMLTARNTAGVFKRAVSPTDYT